MSVNVNKYFLLAVSVILYSLAFIFSASLFWLMFIFLVPLYYVACIQKLSFKEGYLYGAFQWALSGWGILASITNMAQGPWFLRIIPSIAIVCYEGLFGGIWFWGTQKIISLSKVSSVYGRLAIWVATSMVYFIWIIHYSFCIFNYIEGYFLMHPLLPLAEYPPLLSLVGYYGKGLVTLLLLVTNGLLTVPLLVKRRWYLAGLSVVPWIFSVLVAPATLPAPSWVSKIVAIQRSFGTGFTLNPLGEKIQEYLAKITTKYPDVELVVLPESALDRVNLATVPELATYWSEKHVSKALHMVIGSYYWEGDKIRNAVYWLYDGKIKHIFGKRHAMLMTESIAPWYDMSFLNKLYHPQTPVTPSRNLREPFTFFDRQFVPYICSELFFNDRPDDTYPQATILAVCGDTWTVVDYIPRLMHLSARFKAMEWQRPIVYISYLYSMYCDTTGHLTPIIGLKRPDLNRISE